MNHKRVERLWRREGLKVPKKQLKPRRLWDKNGFCVRLRSKHKNHIWSYDFVMDWASNGRAVRMFNVIDEFTRKCLAMEVDRWLNSENVLDVLSQLFVKNGVPEHIRSDNGLEFIARRVRACLASSRSRCCILNQAVLGRPATPKRPMASCGMNCWKERSLIRCMKNKS